jgi:hypothetical protein
MNRIALQLRIRKWNKSIIELSNRINPKIEYWIDKYKVVKVACILGIGKSFISLVLNSYFIYDGLLNVIVLRNVKKEVEEKREIFYKRVESRKEQIFALM